MNKPLSAVGIFLHRPVLSTVLSLFIVVCGFVALQRLSVREYPKVETQVVSVRTVYRGASPEVMESRITKPLENSLSGIEGVDVMTSQSRSEVSNISIRFRLDRDADAAAADVRDRVARVRPLLPNSIDEPSIAKADADAEPILFVVLSGNRHSQLEISEYLRRNVGPRLSTLGGAADVRLYGERRLTMRVWLDRTRLASYRLTPEDVELAMRRENVDSPAGRIESREREFNVVLNSNLRTPEQFSDLVVRSDTDGIVRLRDVAKIELGAADTRITSSLNGAPAVALGVIKSAAANPLDLSRAVRTEVERLRASLPEGMHLEVTFDSTVFIEHALHEVLVTLLVAIGLVTAAIIVFLKNLRATLIPVVAIPVSLAGGLVLLAAFGFSINTITLLAMVLAVGLVVDDAVVVMENVTRHADSGKCALMSALEGTKEVAPAVIAMTLVLVAVYAPLGFATSVSGRLFFEFAVALGGSVLASGLVALTLTPVMSSRLIGGRRLVGADAQHKESVLGSMSPLYGKALEFVLAHGLWTLVVGLSISAVGIALLVTLKSEFAPMEDRGEVIVYATAPEGSTIDYTTRQIAQLEEILATVPEVEKRLTLVGTPTVVDGIIFSPLRPWGDRRSSQSDLIAALSPRLSAVPGVRAFPTGSAPLNQGTGKPVRFVVMMQAPYEELHRLAGQLVAEISKNRGLSAVDSDLRLNKPELRVDLRRDKVADMGIEVDAISQSLETMLSGRTVTRFQNDGEQYDVILQVAGVARRHPEDISSIFVRSSRGAMVPLAGVADLRETVSPRSLNHFNRMRAFTISANLSAGYSLSEALDFVTTTALRLLPAAAATDLDGQSREYRDSSRGLNLAFVVALLFVFLLMAALFESFLDPLVILLTVPLAVTGALVTLYLSGESLSVYSKIGLLTLIGLITKHGILIVDFANRKQAEGRTALEAVVQAARLRLRPILMTTVAMVLGALPLIFATGAGAASRAQIGWVIVGGMLFGTCLALFMVPSAYVFVSRYRRQRAQSRTTHGRDASTPQGR